MPKFTIHYRMTCDGQKEIEAENEEEAREALLSDPRALYEDSDYDDIAFIQIEQED